MSLVMMMILLMVTIYDIDDGLRGYTAFQFRSRTELRKVLKKIFS